MPSSPGTVSKILWHFTGGPRWNEAEKCQDGEPKSCEDAYAAVISILKSREVRIGQYREVLRAVLPIVQHRDPITKAVTEEPNALREVFSVPVCCLADIPIAHLDYHAERYGRMAIGFHRHSAIEHGFNPVFYLLHDSPVLQSFYTGMHRIGGTHDREIIANGQQIISEIVALRPEVPETKIQTLREAFDASITKANVLLETGRGLIERIDSAALNMRTVLAFIKTFGADEFGTIYCEREWRSTNPFTFRYDDISMVVLPRNPGIGNHYERFVEESSSIPIPPTVSIVAWDDLVEH